MQALQIAIPRWNITELNGYEPITTFWQDFSIAVFRETCTSFWSSDYQIIIATHKIITLL